MIRRATPADLPALNLLMRTSSAYQGSYAAILEGYAVDEAQVARDRFGLLEDEGGLAGFYSLTAGPPVELDLMFVADDRQGAGLGARLFEAMKADARAMGASEVRIVSHPPSVGFYERQGAIRMGDKPPSGRVAWARPMLTLALP